MTLSASDRKLVADFLGTVPDEALTFKSMTAFLNQQTDFEPLHIWEFLCQMGAIRPVDPMNPDWFTLTPEGKQMFSL